MGGRFTADDGTVLDSRQSIEGDVRSDVTRTALASSELWWNVVTSLVMPVLSSARSGAFALVIGPRTTATLEADGTLRRSRLSTLLPGGAGRISVTRSDMYADAVPDGYEHAASLTTPNGDSLGHIGLKCENADRPWQLLDGNDYYLSHISSLKSWVIVDTSGSFLGGEEYGPPPAEALHDFERCRRHGPKGLLVVPHTHAATVFLNRYVDWLSSGRARVGANTQPERWGLAGTEAGLPPDPIAYAHPIVVRAEFLVTGLVKSGVWSDPGDLESARSLLEARYDLKLGIWDLVANATLRDTLLVERQSLADTPQAPAPVPPGAAERAASAVTMKLAREAQATTELRRVAVGLESLQAAGWTRLHRSWATCALSDEYAKWPGQEPTSLVSLVLGVTRRSTDVGVRISLYNDINLVQYLEANCNKLENIAGQTLGPFSGRARVLSLAGGWGDDVDWPARSSQLIALTPAWRDVFEGLVQQSLAALAGSNALAAHDLATRSSAADQGDL